MPYLIDGNNLMPLLGTRERKKLLEEVAQFAQTKGIKAMVVFDGAEEDFFPDGSSYKKVKIFYARPNSDADTRIKNLVENSRERRTLFVVTNDRSLSDYCRRCGARVVTARDFSQQIFEAKKLNIEKSRFEGVKADELTEWMRYFGIDETDD
jgi:Predicted RNA-binding protein containing a PIN domain